MNSAVASIALVLTAVGLAGCSAVPGSALSADVTGSLPPGVSISVFQTRFDYGVRQLEIKVTNGTGEPFAVTSAAFDSTRFVGTALWSRSQDIPAGSARDLRVQLGDPVCDSAASADSVTLAFVLPNGDTGRATVTPQDEQGYVDTINVQDCLVGSAAAIAEITPSEQVQWTAGAGQPVTVELTVTPSSGGGTLTIHAARGTTLIAPSGLDGQPIDAIPIERVVDASTPPFTLPLSFIPNRCDVHAVAEDKRGTFLPLELSTSDGRAGTVYLAVTDSVRRSFYNYYADYCGLP